MPLTETEKRRLLYEAGLSNGMSPRQAGIATFPELPPAAAALQFEGTPFVQRVEEYTLSNKPASKAMSMEGLVNEYATEYDMERAAAYARMEESLGILPETDTPIRYDRVDKFMSRTQRRVADVATETSMNAMSVRNDMSYMGLTIHGAMGTSQQALFGTLAGEKLSKILERAWPKADIRDDEGTVQQKALVPLAVKGMTVGMASLLTGVVNPTLSTTLKNEARAVGEQLMRTDWKDGLMTGLEVQEYWMDGAGLFGTSIPDPGTPEREQYDEVVRHNAAKRYAQMGWAQKGGLALSGAMLDVFADPLILISEVPVRGVTLLRKLGAPASKARVTGAIAERTGRIPDLQRAVANAEKWVDDMASLYSAKPTKPNKIKLEHAQEKLVMWEQMLTRRDLPGEQFLMRTAPRINPDHIQPTAGVFLTAPKAARSGVTRRFLSEQVKQEVRGVRKLEKRVERAKTQVEGTQAEMFSAKDLGENIDDLTKQLDVAKQRTSDWVETRKWFQRRTALNKQGRTAAFFKQAVDRLGPYQKTLEIAAGTDKATKLRLIQKNIERGIAQGVSEEDILKWERTYTDVLDETRHVDESIGRGEGTILHPSKMNTKEIIESSMREQRKRAVQLTEPVKDYSFTDTAVQLDQRMAYGPDTTEMVSEAAKVLAAGGEIDDIMYHGMSVDMFNTSYGMRARAHSGTEHRALDVVAQRELASEIEWLGRDPVNTTVEAVKWQQSIGEKFGEFYMKGLHPETWNMRPAGIMQRMRESMRVLQSVNPRLYTRVHNAVRSQEYELIRMNSVFGRELRMMGVHTDLKGATIVDHAKSKTFFRIMDMDPTSRDTEFAMQALSELERRSVRRIRQEMDFVGSKLGIEDTDLHITGYMTHVIDPRWADDGVDVTMQGLAANTEVFDPYLIHRKGKRGYVEDISMALDAYTRAATRKLHLEPLFEDLKEAARIHTLKGNSPGDTWVNSTVDDIINNFKGKPSFLGQWVDRGLAYMNARFKAVDWYNNMHKATPVQSGPFTGATAGIGPAVEKVGQVTAKAGAQLAGAPGKLGQLGGGIAASGVRVTEFGSTMGLHGVPNYVAGDFSRTALGVTALAYSSVLGGSGRYFPMAVATGLATTGSRFGIFGTLRGIMITGTKQGRAIARNVGLEKQWVQIMEDATWTKMGRLAANMPSSNGITVVGPSITATENMIRSWTYHAAIGDMMRKSGLNSWDDVVEAGMASAYMHEAVRTTEEVNHLFGQLGKPPKFNRISKSGSAGGTQFLSFIPKQSEELIQQVVKNPGRIGQYMMISGYLQRVTAKTGMDISEYVGLGFLPGTPDEAKSIVTETMLSFMALNGEFANAALGQSDPNRMHQAWTRMQRNLVNFIPIAMAAQRHGHAVETIRTGGVWRNEELQREANLGQFKWDPEKSNFENVMNLPRATLAATGDPATPTEIMSIGTHINSIQGRLERETWRASRAAQQEHLFRRRQIASSLLDARDTGDMERFNQVLNQAVEEGMLAPDILRMVTDLETSAVIPRLMRMELQSQQNMLDAVEIQIREMYIHKMRFQ